MNMKEIKTGILYEYTFERIIPMPYEVYGHGVLRDIKEHIMQGFWKEKK